MRQPNEDRALYYRQLRQTISQVLLPELTSAAAKDSVGLIDRILAEFIVEEEDAAALSAQFGGYFEVLLHPADADTRPVVTPDRFNEVRQLAADVVARTAGSDDESERDLARQLVEIERAYLEEVDQLRQVVLADDAAAEEAPNADGCSVTKDQLTTYFRRRLRDSPDVVVERLTVVPGGRSKETILVSVSRTHELPPEVIVRKDRPVGVLETRAADEFAVISAVHRYGGVPIPKPFFAEQADHDLGDGTFLVMERVSGHKAGEFFPDLAAPTEYQRVLALQIAAGLARLHSIPLDQLKETGLDVAGDGVTTESVVGMVEGIMARIDDLSGPPCVTVPRARQWLLDHVSDVVPAPRLCLLQGDFGFHNMLVDEDRLTALVDWEAATIGPPARELAAAWNAIAVLTDWPTFIEAYIGAGGQIEDTDQRAIDYYRVLSALGGFMASRMGGHLFRTGTKRDLLTAHSGLDAHFRCARNLARALGDATAGGS